MCRSGRRRGRRLATRCWHTLTAQQLCVLALRRIFTNTPSRFRSSLRFPARLTLHPVALPVTAVILGEHTPQPCRAQRQLNPNKIKGRPHSHAGKGQARAWRFNDCLSLFSRRGFFFKLLEASISVVARCARVGRPLRCAHDLADDALDTASGDTTACHRCTRRKPGRKSGGGRPTPPRA